jgi:hypothetical protein
MFYWLIVMNVTWVEMLRMIINGIFIIIFISINIYQYLII